MERLTHRMSNGEVAEPFSRQEGKRMAEALAAYEDTGLSPEQMREIDRLYAEKCREVSELKKGSLKERTS